MGCLYPTARLRQICVKIAHTSSADGKRKHTTDSGAPSIKCFPPPCGGWGRQLHAGCIAWDLGGQFEPPFGSLHARAVFLCSPCPSIYSAPRWQLQRRGVASTGAGMATKYGLAVSAPFMQGTAGSSHLARTSRKRYAMSTSCAIFSFSTIWKVFVWAFQIR